MKKLTTNFTLPSGVKVEAYQLYGEHYEILTSGQYKESEVMLQFICSLLIQVGERKFSSHERIENIKFVQNLRAVDKELILATVRQASMDFEPEFVFTHKWVDQQGSQQAKKLKVTLNQDDKEDTIKHIHSLIERYGEEHQDFYKELNQNGTFQTTPSKHRADSYNDLQNTYELVLPKTKLSVQVSYLAGWGEQYLNMKENPSTNDLIMARKPQYKSEKGTWINLKVRDLPLKDIEYLRSEIEKNEGKVEMTISFEDPAKKGNLISLNLLSQPAFFFPSEAL